MNLIIVLIFVQSYNWVFCIGEGDPLNGPQGQGRTGNLRGQEHGSDQQQDVNDEGEMTRPVVLDLSLDHPPNVIKTEEYRGRTWIHNYTAIYPITKIVDGISTVWTGSADSPCESARLVSRGNDYKVLTVDIRKSSSSHSRYFEKDGGVWKEMSEEEYEGRFGKREEKREGTRAEETKPKDPPFILDIDAANGPRIRVEERTDRGIRSRSYREVEGTRLVTISKVTSVVAGNFTFWEQKNFEVFEGCDEYTKGGRRLVYVRVDSHGLTRRFFFERGADGSWRNIERSEFDEVLEIMKAPTPPSGGSFTLDIAKLDKTTTTISSTVKDGIVELTLSPKDEGFTTVKYGDRVLWTLARRGEECVGVQVRSKENTTFIRIRVMTMGRSRFLHFKNSENDWVEIPESEFSTALIGNRKGDAEPKVSQEKTSGFCTSSIALLVATILLYTL